jgi:hypothetical protein
MAFTVTYNGNGNTGGKVPRDSHGYASGDPVTVLDGQLTKTGDDFAYWNTAVDGSGTIYHPTNAFQITVMSPSTPNGTPPPGLPAVV